MPGTQNPLSSKALREKLDISIIQITCGAMLLVSAISLLAFLIVGPIEGVAPEARQARMMIGALLASISALGFVLARHGQPRLAAALFGTCTFALMLYIPIALQIGVHSAGLPILGAIIMLAGFLVAPGAALLTAGISIAAIVMLALAEQYDYLAGPTPATAPSLAAITASYIILFIVIGWMTNRYSHLFTGTIVRLENARQELECSLAAQRESETCYRLLIENSPTGILQFDTSLCVTFCNVRLAEIIQLPRTEIIGIKLKELHDVELVAALEQVLDNETVSREGKYKGTFSPIEKWLSMVAAPLVDEHGSNLGGIAIVEDISVRKEAEDGMLQAKEAAEAANQTKGRFLSTVSHELRTPLNGMLGMAQILLMPDVAEEERLEYSRTILNSGQTLLTLLNDILDISKIEAGKFSIHPSVFSPEQLISETASLFTESANQKGLLIETEWQGIHQRYLADPTRLRQMLDNFTSNAIKFSSRGRIRITASECIHHGHLCLHFAVSDEGMGIAEADLPLLFQPFSQIDDKATRSFEGTGLGLSIVRGLAELMNGEVGVDSTLGKGSTFWFYVRAERLLPDQESRETPRD